eukprot:5565510-Pyramimonas_sp.AAC.2
MLENKVQHKHKTRKAGSRQEQETQKVDAEVAAAQAVCTSLGQELTALAKRTGAGAAAAADQG